MNIRFSHTPPDFSLGFLVSPFAGAVAASLVTAVWSVTWGSDFDLGPALLISLMAGVVALVISAAYTLVAGTSAIFYIRISRRVPTRTVALAVAFFGGFVPILAMTAAQFVGINVRARVSEVIFLPANALAASLATALVFWRLALRGRQVPPANSAAEADAARSAPKLP